jgi:hypothetical protein
VRSEEDLKDATLSVVCLCVSPVSRILDGRSRRLPPCFARQGSVPGGDRRSRPRNVESRSQDGSQLRLAEREAGRVSECLNQRE